MKLTEYEEVQSLVRTLVNADRTNERVVTSERLREHVDTILIISNDKLRQQFGNLVPDIRQRRHAFGSLLLPPSFRGTKRAVTLSPLPYVAVFQNKASFSSVDFF